LRGKEKEGLDSSLSTSCSINPLFCRTIFQEERGVRRRKDDDVRWFFIFAGLAGRGEKGEKINYAESGGSGCTVTLVSPNRSGDGEERRKQRRGRLFSHPREKKGRGKRRKKNGICVDAIL